ncbi:hypothetical protein [Echinicola sp. 20G]|uniref:hypothetical protein n=1 Tax=Echinicola sp. 20G TaxID=2781961 RepID=UPI0019104B4C|nr:hypothetical protein [Echinicola sp. 20G]
MSEFRKLVLVMLTIISFVILVLVGLVGYSIKSQLGESNYRTAIEARPASIFYQPKKIDK